METRHGLRQADLVTSILLILLGLVLLYAASQMPWTTQYGMASSWYLSPGLFPALLGVLLIVFSGDVLRTALMAGAHKGLLSTLRKQIVALPGNHDVIRSFAVLFLIGCYVFIGLGHFDYYVVSSLFCLAMMLIFYRPDGRFPGIRGIALVVAVSVLGPLAIGQIFSRFFQVPLP